MLVDSHCHLDRLNLSNHNNDLTAALISARQQGVEHFLCVCIDLLTFPDILAIAQNYPDVSVSLGLHPTEPVPHEPTTEELISLASHAKVVALGETGLDYYHDDTPKALQQERFRRHIRAAKHLGKPLIVHTRQARADTLQILAEENAADVSGVLHCFTEDWAMAQKAIEQNFYISFSGIVTFRNAVELKEIAQKVPLDRMLIETDSPFLAPAPYRGKPNEPAYVRLVAEHIAELRGVSLETIAQHTTENFFKLFRIK